MSTVCSSVALAPARDFILPRFHWRIIADDIRSMGKSYRQQAIGLGVEMSTMQRWLDGGEPTFSVGRAWLSMHSETCGATLTQRREEEAIGTR